MSVNTVLLLHMNGSNESTAFVDSSSFPIPVSAYGNAKISTAQSKFGGSSAYFDGSGDGISAPSLSVFGLGTQNFTIEFWMYPTRNVGNEVCVDLRTSDGSTPLLIGKSSAGAVRCYDGTTVRTGGTLTLNAWQHIAWCRSGNSHNVYLDGTSVINFTSSFDAGSNRPLTIGTNVLTSAENYQGYLDELRISKGVARYTASFTPPSAAFDDLVPNNRAIIAPYCCDLQDGGGYRIAGNVTELGVAGAYRVRLHDKLSGRLIRETWSADDGTYSFENIANRTDGYYLVAHDHGASPRNGDIVDTGIVLETLS